MIVTLKHLQDLPEYQSVQPYELYGYPNADSPPRTNFVYEYCQTDMTDAREGATPYTIQGAGFTWVRHPSKCPLSAEYFESAEAGNDVVHTYLQETLQLVEKQLGTSQLCVMDWRVSLVLLRKPALK
jgi:hypothetical protein